MGLPNLNLKPVKSNVRRDYGNRKLILAIFTQILLFIGITIGKIPGDTGAWAIVSVISASIVGYGSEYAFKQNKQPKNAQFKGKTRILKEK